VEGLQALISCSHSIYFVYISDGPLELKEFAPLNVSGELFSRGGYSALATIAIDLGTGSHTDLNFVCFSGKFPAIASNGTDLIVGWIGAPALPIELQGPPRPASSQEMFGETLAKLASSYVDSVPNSVGQMTGQLPHVWTPMWLARVSSDGIVHNPVGPVGYQMTPNNAVRLALSDNKGLVAWRSGDDFEACSLMARYVSL
jgi:hypothetical protein